MNMTGFDEMRNLDKSKRISQFILKIEYLRTYLNAGSINVLLCGKSIGTIDALWSNNDMKHYSLSQVAYISVCSFSCTNFSSVMIEIIYENIDETDDIKREKRGNQKFKIISINSCLATKGCEWEDQNRVRIY